jgi:hypothetical protein
MKTAWYLHKNKHENKWNRIGDPDMNPHSYVCLIFFTKAPKTCDEEKTASSTNVAGQSSYLPAKTETRSIPVTLD